MKSRLVAATFLTVLLVGCAGTRSQGTTPGPALAPAASPETTAPAPVTQTPVTPAPAAPAPTTAEPGPTAAELCTPLPPTAKPEAHDKRQADLVAFLEAGLAGSPAQDANAAVKALAPCLVTGPVKASEGGAITVNLKGFVSGGALVYRVGQNWQVGNLEVDPFNHIVPKTVINGDRLIAVTDTMGTGHYGQLQLYALAPTFKLLWQSPVYDHFGVDVLSNDYVLTYNRTPDVYKMPFAVVANCCLPSDGEVLWQRQGDQFAKLAERTVPTPFRTVSLFVGAVKQGALSTARQVAASDQVVQAGVAAKDQLTADPWFTAGPDSLVDAGWKIQQEEARYWDAIPANLRGPKPTVTQVISPSGKLQLVVTRQPEGWKVSAVQPRP